MEVHHHPDTEKKGIKEYLLEGLMIFLAVTLGFFAESLRENLNKNEKETEYIKSLVANLGEDTLQLAENIQDNQQKIESLDSLLQKAGTDMSDSNNRKALYHFENPVSLYSRFLSNDATMMQLKSSGGMQFIRKDHIADSIARYDQAVRDIYAAEISYAKAINEGLDASLGILNFTKDIAKSNNKKANTGNYPLLSNDPLIIQVYFNKIAFEKGWTENYVKNLTRIIPFQHRLIELLKKEYDLD